MKEFIKDNTPRRLFYVLRGFVDKVRAIMAYRYDRKRFMKHYGYGGVSDSRINTEAHIIFHTHQLEKGLSHVHFRDGFGKEALKNLRVSLDKLPNHNSTAYIAALSAVKAYLEMHELRKHDISEQKTILGEALVAEASKCDSDISGYHVITKESKANNNKISFKDLFKNRYTVREFSGEPVDIEKIYEAIDISTKTPTVCNRQSFRMVVIKNQEKIKQALMLQNGFRGYAYPPVLAVVLTDAQAFRGVTERNNQYIDGGSFLMSFLLGLEYVGLAACPLNTMFSIADEKKTRKTLGIADNYNFISYIAIGNFMDQNKVAKSFRFPVEEIIVEIE